MQTQANKHNPKHQQQTTYEQSTKAVNHTQRQIKKYKQSTPQRQ